MTYVGFVIDVIDGCGDLIGRGSVVVGGDGGGFVDEACGRGGGDACP